MHKGIAGTLALTALAAAGFVGLAAWQGSEVDVFHGKTFPLPGDVFEAKVSTEKLDFLHCGVLVEVRAKGAGADNPAVATWSGEVGLGLFPRLRLVLSEEDKRAAGLEVDDELTVGFSPFGREKDLQLRMRNLRATEADLLCETADYNLSIDLDRSVARLQGAPLRCTIPAANLVFEAGPLSLTYDGWTDDPYVGRLTTEIESLRYGDEWRVGRVRTVSSTTKLAAPESKEGRTGGVLDTVNVTYGQTFEWEMENVSSAHFPLETKRFVLRSHADKMPARVFDYLMALAVQGDFGGADPLEAVGVLQDAFVRGGFTVDVDESRWETNVGEASFAGRLAAVKADEKAPLQLGAFSLLCDETLLKAVSGAEGEALVRDGYLKRTGEGKLSSQIVIDEEKLTVNGKRVF